MQSNSSLDHLMKMLGALPGLGSRSARRIALYLLQKRSNIMVPLAEALLDAAENVKECESCGNLDMLSPCHICRDEKRDPHKICVVAGVADLWAIERTSVFKGRYHILGGVLSALDGIGPDDLRLDSLRVRVQEPVIQEVILALSATVDGQSTAHYIADHIARPDLTITRLAHGVPVGGELDYLDDGTIVTALNARASN